MLANNKNMKHVIFFLISIFLLCGCENTQQQKADYVFDKAQSVELSKLSLKNEFDVSLESTGDMLNVLQSKMFVEGNEYFISSLYDVMRLDSCGNIINKIGELGHAANEYIEFEDYYVDSHKKTVLVLAPNRIYHYDYNGAYLKKDNLDIPATSFIKHNEYYWFATGRNGYKNSKLFRTDHQFKNVVAFLDSNSDVIPIKENNFGRGTFLTFKESYTHDIYVIENGNPEKKYTFEFKGLEIPNGLFEGDAMDVYKKMSSNSYAVIHTFLENQNYIFMLVQEYNEEREVPYNYFWCINKSNKKDIVLNIPDEAFEEYGNPQFLSNNNILYFVGNKMDQTVKDQNEKSSHIFGISLNQFI